MFAAAVLTLALSACSDSYAVFVFNPCDRPVRVILSDAWDSRETREAEGAQGYTWERTDIGPQQTAHVGEIYDAAGATTLDHGWTIWVDDQNLRLDFTTTYVVEVGPTLTLPIEACSTSTPAEGQIAVFQASEPVEHQPYREPTPAQEDDQGWGAIPYLLVGLLIGIPVAASAHRKAKAAEGAINNR